MYRDKIDIDTQQSTLQHLFDKNGVEIFLKRDDQIHDQISGNKWRKLKYNLRDARQKGMQRLLTFGGAYSNHIAAVAAAGQEFSFETIAVVRGEEVDNPTLAMARQQGMKLYFTSREQYRQKADAWFLRELEDKFGPFYLLPEGGSNQLALPGVREMLDEIEVPFTHLAVCAGTGGTAAGLLSGMLPDQTCLCFPALKGDFMREEIENLLGRPVPNLIIQSGYHFGGYARWQPELVHCIQQFYREFKIKLDPIYTGKMMYGVWDMIENDFFPSGSKVVCVHSGGLQGSKGFQERFGISLYPD